MTRSPEHLTDLLAEMGLLTLLVGVTGISMTFLATKEAARMQQSLRCHLFERILNLPLATLAATRTGESVARLMGDIDQTKLLFGSALLELSSAVLSICLVITYIAFISPSAAALSLVTFAIVCVSLRHAMVVAHDAHGQTSRAAAALHSWLTEVVSSYRLIRVFALEDTLAANHVAMCNDLRRHSIRSSSITFTANIGTTTAVGVVLSMIAFLSAQQVLAGRLTVGMYINCIGLYTIMSIPLFQLVNVSLQISEGLAAVTRLRDLFDRPPREADRAISDLKAEPIRSIELRRVHFGYTDNASVLTDVSFSAHTGRITALVGRSGSGKSTLLAILAGLYAPIRGEIVINDVAVRVVSDSGYRKRIGVVLQETLLVNASIIENVRLGDTGASHADVVRMCELTGITEFAETLPDGCETTVGDGASALSGGQRQRIGLARALLRNPEVLILDEPTSHLDPIASSQFWDLIRLRLDSTLVIVATHATEWSRKADQIVVLEAGHVASNGSHSDLLSHSRLYRRFHSDYNDEFSS